MSWCTAIVGEEELDRRFKAMNKHGRLRHFGKGISTISQWTGTEHKEMQKVLLGLLAGSVNTRVLTVVRSLIDFIYLARLQSHTSDTLDALQLAFNTFHANKAVLVELGIREHFNIPKVHSMEHYMAAIRTHGSADGFNTESPERLHIDLAKATYRSTNKHDYVEQMAVWLQRQEAVHLRNAYLSWTVSYMTSKIYGDDSDLSDSDNEAPPSNSESHVEEEETTSNGYKIAKRSPFPDTPISYLETQYGAVDFLPALQAFLKTPFPHTYIQPNQ